MRSQQMGIRICCFLIPHESVQGKVNLFEKHLVFYGPWNLLCHVIDTVYNSEPRFTYVRQYIQESFEIQEVRVSCDLVLLYGEPETAYELHLPSTALGLPSSFQ